MTLYRRTYLFKASWVRVVGNPAPSWSPSGETEPEPHIREKAAFNIYLPVMDGVKWWNLFNRFSLKASIMLSIGAPLLFVRSKDKWSPWQACFLICLLRLPESDSSLIFYSEPVIKMSAIKGRWLLLALSHLLGLSYRLESQWMNTKPVSVVCSLLIFNRSCTVFIKKKTPYPFTPLLARLQFIGAWSNDGILFLQREEFPSLCFLNWYIDLIWWRNFLGLDKSLCKINECKVTTFLFEYKSKSSIMKVLGVMPLMKALERLNRRCT